MHDTVRAGHPSAVRSRVRAALPLVVQCALGAPAAWWIAEDLLGHPRPVFAATAAVICLAAGIGGRARQAVDLLVGVVVGVGVGEVLTALPLALGPGLVLLAVVSSLLAISLVDIRPLALIQAGASALFVLTLPPTQTTGGRLLDTAVGGAIGLLGSQVLFAPDPVPMVTGPAHDVLHRVAAALVAMVDDEEARAAHAHAHAAVGGLGVLRGAHHAARDVAGRTVRGRLRRRRLAALAPRLDEIAPLASGVLALATTAPSSREAAATSAEALAALAAAAEEVLAAWPGTTRVELPASTTEHPHLDLVGQALRRVAGEAS